MQQDPLRLNYRLMKRSGRVSPLVIIGIICILLIVPLFVVAKKDPGAAAADFLTALGQGDVDKLAQLSVIGGADEAKRKEMWQTTMKRSRHYLFVWRITNVVKNTPDSAVATLDFRRNVQLRMGQDSEKFELPLIKKDGDWKVDVQSMDRAMFPGLPGN